jgi:hypothetical protein
VKKIKKISKKVLTSFVPFGIMNLAAEERDVKSGFLKWHVIFEMIVV